MGARFLTVRVTNMLKEKIGCSLRLWIGIGGIGMNACFSVGNSKQIYLIVLSTEST